MLSTGENPFLKCRAEAALGNEPLTSAKKETHICFHLLGSRIKKPTFAFIFWQSFLAVHFSPSSLSLWHDIYFSCRRGCFVVVVVVPVFLQQNCLFSLWLIILIWHFVTAAFLSFFKSIIILRTRTTRVEDNKSKKIEWKVIVSPRCYKNIISVNSKLERKKEKEGAMMRRPLMSMIITLYFALLPLSSPNSLLLQSSQKAVERHTHTVWNNKSDKWRSSFQLEAAVFLPSLFHLQLPKKRVPAGLVNCVAADR